MNVTTRIEIINASEKELESISRKSLLSLNLVEMKAVQDYFKKIGRNPTDIEIETIAQTWSEHCKHKTLSASVDFVENGKRRTYGNLLKETVFKATKELNKKWCISVFKDNAGIIEFDKDYGIAFKVETHNHPSALEPYGGAGTGIGGVIRDIIGVGLGAKPIMNTDIFCFGPIDYPHDKIKGNVLHPRRIMKGVVSGVRDYGNRMGIPTTNGAILFDEGYVLNPLVYCGTVGIIPKSKCFKKVSPGEIIVAVGGKTGRDGIHGATFSSIELDKDTEISAVQIGNPIVEKKVLDTILQARDLGLYTALTDCGAGGFSSAIGELGSECGAKVFIDKAPLKYEGLLPWEIWLSEAQERMVLSVPKKNIKKIVEIFESENVEATILGEFTNTGKLEVFYKKERICDLSMQFMHEGVPKRHLKAVWNDKPQTDNRKINIKDNLGTTLKKILSMPNVCSKE
ncbi:MAG: AIR synthase-related protein, partial [Elusimicrobiota bacterium]